MAVFVVFGAGGPTGRQCVEHLLSAGSSTVRAVVRNPDKYKSILPQGNPKLEIVRGDVTNPASLPATLAGADGAIFAASATAGYFSAEAVDNLGVAHVAAAAKEAGVKRVVLISSMLTHPSNRWAMIRVILNNVKYSLMDHKFKGENALRSSGVSYCVVKPAHLVDTPGGQSELVAEFNTTKESGGKGPISRSDVGAVAVAALTNPKAANTTLSISSVRGKASTIPLGEQIGKIFEAALPDPAPTSS